MSFASLSPLRRAKVAFVWRQVRRRAHALDPSGRGLDRIRKFIRVSEGLEPAGDRHPLQRSHSYVDGLTARPWHEPSELASVAALEAACERIGAEVRKVPLELFRPREGPIVLQGWWRRYQLYAFGCRIEENCRRCPETMAIIESLPRRSTAGHVYFSALGPGGAVALHAGETNARLRTHMGLVVAPGYELTVASEMRPCREGECRLFDDSFEHGVRNASAQTCFALVVDFWHPELSDLEVEALEEIMRISRSAEASRRRARDYARQAVGARS